MANVDFNPTIEQMIDDLERDPKGVGEKKHGKLAGKRAYEIDYRNESWRAVYAVIEAERLVRVVSFAIHDKAYQEAEHRS